MSARKASQAERMAPRVQAAREALRQCPNADITIPQWERLYGIVVETRAKADQLAAKGDRSAAKSLRLRASYAEKVAVELVEMTPESS